MNEQKLFGGARIRRLRAERGRTQAQMSEDLGISVSYLNLIERDQRPVTAQLLVRLAESYDVDLKTFAGTDEARALAGLKEVFADPLLKGHKIDAQEIKSVAQASPETSQAILALYHAYREAVANAAELAERVADQDRLAPANAIRFPAEEVRDFLHSRNNHYAELETAAEELHERAKLVPEELFSGLKAYLAQKLGIGCTILPVDVLPNTLRWYDRHRRRVLLSEMLNESGRVFQLAYQIGLLEHGETIERIVADSKLSTPEAQRLSRVTLANYFAGATMMPYQRFLTAAETTRYDIDVLCQRFGAGFEQICHRLTTLQRREARGVPFFMIRVDTAGNVSKRFSAGSFQFARLGGACPRWNVHTAFQTPGRIVTQLIQMPDGARYFSIARTVGRSGHGRSAPDQHFAVALGCEIGYAKRIAYADGHDTENGAADTPIGINCRLCERTDCNQRAFPPLNRRLVVDEYRREISPFSFAPEA